MNARPLPTRRPAQARRPRPTDHRGGIREDADDVGAMLNLLIQVFEGVRAVQLSLMLDRQMSVREDVFGGLFEDGRGAGEPCAEAVGDLSQLRQRRGVIRLAYRSFRVVLNGYTRPQGSPQN